MQYQDQPASGSTTLFPTRHNKLLVRWLCIGVMFVRCGLALSPVSFRCLNVSFKRDPEPGPVYMHL